jgi:hypothetical protein
MNKQSFEIFHWEFFIDNDVINVYEKRSVMLLVGLKT